MWGVCSKQRELWPSDRKKAKCGAPQLPKRWPTAFRSKNRLPPAGDVPKIGGEKRKGVVLGRPKWDISVEFNRSQNEGMRVRNTVCFGLSGKYSHSGWYIDWGQVGRRAAPCRRKRRRSDRQ